MMPAARNVAHDGLCRSDVPPPNGLAPLSTRLLADHYRDFVVQADLVTSLRKRFLAYTGPVVNKST